MMPRGGGKDPTEYVLVRNRFFSSAAKEREVVNWMEHNGF
jgi:hypothetical protein